MTDMDKVALRAMSHAAFGQQYRLEYMLAIAADIDKPVSRTELSEILGLGPSKIQGAFDHS